MICYKLFDFFIDKAGILIYLEVYNNIPLTCFLNTSLKGHEGRRSTKMKFSLLINKETSFK